jgi:hypothetical protein
MTMSKSKRFLKITFAVDAMTVRQRKLLDPIEADLRKMGSLSTLGEKSPRSSLRNGLVKYERASGFDVADDLGDRFCQPACHSHNPASQGRQPTPGVDR